MKQVHAQVLVNETDGHPYHSSVFLEVFYHRPRLHTEVLAMDQQALSRHAQCNCPVNTTHT